MISALPSSTESTQRGELCSLETLPFVKGKRLPIPWGLRESKADPVTVVPVDLALTGRVAIRHCARLRIDDRASERRQ
jgi:hypothetical protein